MDPRQSRRSTIPVGIAVTRPSPAAIIQAVTKAEEDGLPTVWSTVVGSFPDAVTCLAIAAAQTQWISVGTSGHARGRGGSRSSSPAVGRARSGGAQHRCRRGALRGDEFPRALRTPALLRRDVR